MKRLLLFFLVLTSCAPVATSTAPTAPRPTARQSLIAQGASDKRVLRLVGTDGQSSQLARTVARDHLVYGFQYGVNRIYMDIKNTDVYPVRVIWDQSTFTTADGQTSGVYHDKIAVAKARDPQAPTTIAPGSTLEDFVAPAALLVIPPNGKSLTPQPLLTSAKDNRTFVLNLAVEINGEIKMHDFAFRKF